MRSEIDTICNADKYEELAECLWSRARGADVVDASVCSAIIREHCVWGPRGEAPEKA